MSEAAQIPDFYPEDEEKPIQGPIEVDFSKGNPPAPKRNQFALIKHENETFRDQLVPLTGHAYLGCRFERCTLVYDGSPFVARDCVTAMCHVKINTTVLAGNPDNYRSFKVLADWVALVSGAKP